MITDISQLDPNGTYTYAGYLKWQFEEWVELLSGRYSVFNKPGRSTRHHQIIKALGLQILKKTHTFRLRNLVNAFTCSFKQSIYQYSL